MIVPGNWSFRAFVEDTVLTFSIDTADALHQYRDPIIWTIKETGSEMADVYTQYQNETDQAYYLSLLKQLKMANTASDRAAIMNKMDSARTPMFTKQKLWIENYVRQHPSGIAGPFIFNELIDQSLSGESRGYLQSIIDQFSGAAKTSLYYKEVVTKVGNLKNKEVNAIAPDFTLLKRDKTKFTLSSTRGKFTMIDFWASWCVPCRAGIPHWKKVYAKYHKKGFEIVSVSDDSHWKDWIPALDKEQMPWTQVIDEFPSKDSTAKVISLYGVHSMPFFVLLDKEGKILLASGDEDLMTKKIEEVLKRSTQRADARKRPTMKNTPFIKNLK
jgi:thiol-disulfide isomerase/thioredoxin